MIPDTFNAGSFYGLSNTLLNFYMKTFLLSTIAKFLKKNHGKNYPQLWFYVPKNPTLKKMVQWLCGLTHHELSKTEWGYGGGDMADRWCRWCNKLIEVPKDSIRFEFKESPNINLMNDIDKKV